MERERGIISKMKVVLVLPPAEKISEKKDTPTHQHVGLGYLAAMLEKNNIDVAIVNAKLDRMTAADTLKRVLSLRPDIVGITAMTHEINMASKLAASLKKDRPDLFIVIGGVHVTALPQETIKANSAFDAGIIGEGERSFLDIIRKIEKKDYDLSELHGVVYRKNGDVVLSLPSERIGDLDELPFPAWHMFQNATEYILITSRGCPFSCLFCMRALGQQVRKRSASNVVDEIEKVVRQRKPKRFLFYDETFTLDKKHVHEICDLLIQKGLSNAIRWSATTRVDSISEDILQKMKKAGCDHIEFGVESGDQKVLETIKKGITIEQAKKAISLAKNLGFHTETAFIIGHPDETIQTAYSTLKLASKLNADIVQLGIMVPYPGTEVAQLASKGMGGYKIISHNWSDYNKQLGNALELENLSRKDMERLQLIGYLKVFVYNWRFLDLARFIWNFRREMIAFLKNHLKGKKASRPSRINFLLMTKMIFER
jgi:radical SAM superfamily enzyme YgiQ (UPF0313 family)